MDVNDEVVFLPYPDFADFEAVIDCEFVEQWPAYGDFDSQIRLPEELADGSIRRVLARAPCVLRETWCCRDH
jgi:hypothetical protein